jgi:hypothetical protein
METQLTYKLTDLTGTVAEGAAKAALEEKYFTLTPELGEPQLIAYTDIIAITDADYQVTLKLSGNQILTLTRLGYQYEDFLTQLYRFRGEQLLKLLLMDEKQLQAGYTAQYTQLNQQGQAVQLGTCEVRVCETALIGLPQKSDPIRQPYSYLQQVTAQDYKLTLTDEAGEKLELTQLGEKFDSLTRVLNQATSALTRRSQETVKALAPEADPATVSKLALMLKDGKAAKRKDIEALAPALWKRLIKQAEAAGLAKEIGFLETSAQKDNVCMGVKRGLMGDLTGSYVWLLFPMRDSNSGRLMNAVAMEAFTASDAAEPKKEVPRQPSDAASATEETDADSVETQVGGKATYFFKTMNRTAYAQASDAQVATGLDGFLRVVNRCMVDVNFRREPIYLSEDALDNPKYTAYRYAIAKLPSLQTLRSLFIGRVVHSTFDQWQGDVASLLNFNLHSTSELDKWKRGNE